MKRHIFFLIVVFIANRLFAADNYLSGSRAAGMGNAAVTLDDVWAVSHNQAGLAMLLQPSAGIYFENRFMVKELSVKSFALALPVKNSGVFAVSGTQFGYSKYNEKKAGLAYARKLGRKISIGIQLDYLSTFIADDYGSRGTMAVEGGILAEPLSNLRLGVHIFNPTRAKLAEYGDERVPVLFRVGAGYSFSNKVIFCAEVEKDIDYNASFRGGIEYHPVEQLYLRGGISTNPVQSSFGFGLKLKNFRMDVSASYHQVLGFSPQLGLSYDFQKQ